MRFCQSFIRSLWRHTSFSGRDVVIRVDDESSDTKHSDDAWRLLSIQLLAEVEVKSSQGYTVR